MNNITLNETKKRLFEAMRQDMRTMSEYGDNETELLQEIATADNNIIDIYIDTFLN